MSSTKYALRAAVVSVMSSWAVITSGTLAEPAAQAVPIAGCPALYVLAVQGTGESSVTASPTADADLLGAVLGPVEAAVPTLVQRSYLGYPAGFGGAVPGGGTAPYVTSVTDAVHGIDDTAAHVARTCPHSMLAGIGYSQGAQAWSSVAQAIGAGHGPVPANRIAAVILYGDPDRAAGAPTFPGRPGQIRPDPVPSTRGTAVAGVQITTRAAPGGGIGSNGPAFGALTGRVADICDDRDMVCSAPDHAVLLQFAARLLAQADLRDPVVALGSLNALLSRTLGTAWTTVIDQDMRVGNGTVDYAPRKSLGQRLIDAADPRVPAPSPAQTAAAASRWGQITATVMGNPLGLLPALAGQLAAAVTQLAADNANLINPVVWAQFAGSAVGHTGYTITGQLTSVIAWLIACAHDIAGSHS